MKEEIKALFATLSNQELVDKIMSGERGKKLIRNVHI